MPAGQNLTVFLGTGEITKPVIPPGALVDFGLQMAAITPELRAKYKIDPKQEGVVITAVAMGSQAADRGIDAGLVIMKVRDTAVASPEDVVKSVNAERQQKRPFVPMQIADSDGPHWVPFTLN